MAFHWCCTSSHSLSPIRLFDHHAESRAVACDGVITFEDHKRFYEVNASVLQLFPSRVVALRLLEATTQRVLSSRSFVGVRDAPHDLIDRGIEGNAGSGYGPEV